MSHLNDGRFWLSPPPQPSMHQMSTIEAPGQGHLRYQINQRINELTNSEKPGQIFQALSSLEKIHGPLAQEGTVERKDGKCIKSYSCRLCPYKSVKAFDGIATHVVFHHGQVKPWPCSHRGCDKSFCQRNDRDKHQRTHTDGSGTDSSSSDVDHRTMHLQSQPLDWSVQLNGPVMAHTNAGYSNTSPAGPYYAQTEFNWQIPGSSANHYGQFAAPGYPQRQYQATDFQPAPGPGYSYGYTPLYNDAPVNDQQSTSKHGHHSFFGNAEN